MCGLVAMVTKFRHGFNQNNTNFFDHLLFIDTIRGEDSTGVFMVDNLGNVRIAKGALNGPDFINSEEYKNLKNLAVQRGWALVGHNRKATRGTINDENAHPFWVDDKLVLVHNGTMFGDHKKHADVEVDSHAIAHILAEEENVEKALQKVDAAYALIWYNIAKKQLHFIRNSQRPLAWCETASAFYFASEKDMLEYVATRTNTEITSKGDDGVAKAWDITPSTLDIWELKQDKSTTVSSVPIDTTFRRPVQSYKTPTFGHRDEDLTHWEGWVCESGVWQRPSVKDACAYSGYDASDDEPAHVVLTRAEREDLQKQLDKTLAKVELHQSQAIVPASAPLRLESKIARIPKPMPAWAAEVDYNQWTSLRPKYETGSFVRVLAKDYLPDADPETVWMTGITCDGKELFSVFPVSKSVFDRVTAKDSNYMKEGRALFTVEIELVGWRRDERLPMPGNFNDAEGHAYITGKTAKPIVTLAAANA